VSVYRGAGLARTARTAAWIALAYVALLAAAWALGLTIYDWRGWVFVLAPFAGWLGVRVWSFARVSIELADGMLRYEGARPRDDLEIPLDTIASATVDRGGLVVTTHDGREHMLELSNEAAAGAARRLRAR
jgi:hypothetical protein